MKFEKQTSVDLCHEIAENWYANYRSYINNRAIFGTNFDYYGIWEKLKALQGQGTPEQIAEIIGNDSWTTMGCSLCHKQKLTEWLVGIVHDYATVICFDCVGNLYRSM